MATTATGLGLAAGAGALVGGVGGLMANEAEKSALSKQLRYLKSLEPKIQAQYQDRINLIQNQLNQVEQSAGGEGAVQDFYSSLKAYDPNKFIYDPATQEQFNYSKTEKDFVDAGAQYRQDAAAKATQDSLAGQGNLFSGGAGRQLMKESQDYASQEFAASNARMVADRENAYKMYRDKVSDIKDKLSAQSTGQIQQIKFKEIPKTDIYGARTTASGQNLSSLDTLQQNQLDLSNTIAGVQSNRDKVGGWQGAASSFIGGATPGASAGANIYSALGSK